MSETIAINESTKRVRKHVEKMTGLGFERISKKWIKPEHKELLGRIVDALNSDDKESQKTTGKLSKLFGE